MKLSLGLFEDGYNKIVMCPGAIDTKLRNLLTISNNNVRSFSQDIKPIVDAVNGVYKSGDVVFYRKMN